MTIRSYRTLNIIRVQNHHYSEKSKSNGKPSAKEAIVEIGNIVYIKSDGSKHLARELYLVTSVDYKSSEAYVQKLVGNQFREKKYLVKFSEIYLVPSSKSGKCSSERPDSDDDIELSKYTANDMKTADDAETSHDNVVTDNELLAEPCVPLRRSDRARRPPDRLATEEIEQLT